MGGVGAGLSRPRAQTSRVPSSAGQTLSSGRRQRRWRRAVRPPVRHEGRGGGEGRLLPHLGLTAMDARSCCRRACIGRDEEREGGRGIEHEERRGRELPLRWKPGGEDGGSRTDGEHRRARRHDAAKDEAPRVRAAAAPARPKWTETAGEEEAQRREREWGGAEKTRARRRWSRRNNKATGTGKERERNERGPENMWPKFEKRRGATIAKQTNTVRMEQRESVAVRQR